MQPPIYLDYNATTPLLPEVADAMQPFLTEQFGNPSSSHLYGRRTKSAVEKARKQLAALINADPGEIIFTSGGSEANNMAIKNIAFADLQPGKQIVISAFEHPAVENVCRWLARFGIETVHVPVDGSGLVQTAEVEKALGPNTILVSIMLANNEAGTIQPLEEITQLAHKMNIPVHTDAAQAAGKIPLDVQKLGIDLMTIAGHKFHGPKGIGALYVKTGFGIEPFIHGASQENGRRAGTENIMEIAGIGMAAEVAESKMEEKQVHSAKLRDRLLEKIVTAYNLTAEEVLTAGDDGGNLPVKVNGHPELRLPNTLNISFRHVEANRLIDALEDKVAVSAGAACHSDGTEISAVLQAMHIPMDYAVGTLRLSVGWLNTVEEIDMAAYLITQVAKQLHKEFE